MMFRYRFIEVNLFASFIRDSLETNCSELIFRNRIQPWGLFPTQNEAFFCCFLWFQADPQTIGAGSTVRQTKMVIQLD